MRWTTPAELLEIYKGLIQIACYMATLAIVGWTIWLGVTTAEEMIQESKKRKAAQAERAKLEAWRRYNERMEILNDPDYYGEI